jgi:hypothetical protein
MAFSFQYKPQLLGNWDSAKGFLIQQYTSLLDQLLPVSKLVDTLTIPYASNSQLVTNGTGTPIFSPFCFGPLAFDPSCFAGGLQVQAVQNDYAPPNWQKLSVVTFSSPASNITGFLAPSPLVPVFKLLINTGETNASITLVHLSAQSVAVNRLRCPGLTNYVLTKGSSVWLVYDTRARLWQVIDKV